MNWYHRMSRYRGLGAAWPTDSWLDIIQTRSSSMSQTSSQRTTIVASTWPISNLSSSRSISMKLSQITNGLSSALLLNLWFKTSSLTAVSSYISLWRSLKATWATHWRRTTRKSRLRLISTTTWSSETRKMRTHKTIETRIPTASRRTTSNWGQSTIKSQTCQKRSKSAQYPQNMHYSESKRFSSVALFQSSCRLQKMLNFTKSTLKLTWRTNC